MNILNILSNIELKLHFANEMSSNDPLIYFINYPVCPNSCCCCSFSSSRSEGCFCGLHGFS